MTLSILVGLYAAVGLAFAAMLLTRSPRTWRTAGSAALAFVLWPLWAPFAQTAKQPTAPPRRQRHPASDRVQAALSAARSRVAGSPLDGLLTDADLHAIASQVERVVARIQALETELARLRTGGADTSGRRQQCVTRVQQALERDERALDELGDLADALATELTLAQWGHSDTVETLVAELSARIEALAAA